MFFIDFQTLSIGHPSKDFWYFLYCSTDSKWRKEHLEECFETYFNTFQTYLKQTRIEITYEDFKIEFLGMVSNEIIAIETIFSDNHFLVKISPVNLIFSTKKF